MKEKDKDKSTQIDRDGVDPHSIVAKFLLLNRVRSLLNSTQQKVDKFPNVSNAESPQNFRCRGYEPARKLKMLPLKSGLSSCPGNDEPYF